MAEQRVCRARRDQWNTLRLGESIPSVSYKPSKEHLDNQIPQFFQQLNGLICGFKADTGADDVAVAAMLRQLAEKYQANCVLRDGFGFR